MGLRVFGDSHAHYLFSRVPEATVSWLGPRTMHRVGRDGVDFADMVRDGETLLFVFGEIDVRCHITELARSSSIDAVVSDLAERFARSIADFGKKVPNSRLAVLAVIPPITPEAANPLMPCIGSESERVLARRSLNSHLRARCANAGITFVDVPLGYENSDGLLKRHMSDGHAHIARDCANGVILAVSSALGMRLTFDQGNWFSRVARAIARHFASLFHIRLWLWNLGKA